VLLFDLFDGSPREQTVFEFAVRSAFFQLRSGKDEAGIDYASGTDFTVSFTLNLDHQHISALFIEQSGEVKGERTGKALTHADIFVVAPDADNGISSADKESGTLGIELAERNTVPHRTGTVSHQT